MQSPMYPKAPPSKKQRSNQGEPLRGGGRPPPPTAVDSVSDAANDALTRRRAQLQSLRQQQQTAATTTRSDLLAKARNHLKVSGGPPLGSNFKPNGASNNAGPQNMPNSNPLGPRRESDIFPDVPKSPIQAKPIAINLSSQVPQFPVMAPPRAAVPPPMRPSAPSIAAATPKVAPPGVDPLTIARRLDFAGGSSNATPGPPVDASRAKSAPRVRAPPQPPTPALVKEAPPTMMTKKEATPKRPSPKQKTPPAAIPLPTKATSPKMPTPSPPTSTAAVAPRHGHQPQRPPPITPTMGNAPSPPATAKSTASTTSSRRDFLSSMRQYADSPSVSSKSKNSELQLIRELKKVHQDKEDAFRQVVRLRDQIHKLQKQDRKGEESRKAEEYQQLVALANRDGDRAALRWAREQASSSVKKKKRSIYPQSPLSAQSRTASPSRRALTPAMGPGVRKRVSTPHPKRTNMNGEEDKFLAKATETNPDEFDSDVATYIVRRPYAPHNDDFWKDVGELSKEEYKKTASVGKPMSLEICANIKADGSILVLSGISNVRHKKPRGKKWKIFDEVDALDKPLGSVMFIDGQANEGEYWLDEIYEEAMSTRDTYCSSLLSTATALKTSLIQQVAPQICSPEQVVASPPAQMNGNQDPPMMQQQPMQQQEQQWQAPVEDTIIPAMQLPVMQQKQSPPMMKELPIQHQPATILKEASVQPSANLQPVEVAEPKKAVKVKKESPEEEVKKQEAPTKKKKVSPPPEEEEAASDLLSTVLGMLLLGIYNFIQFILVTVIWGGIKTIFFSCILGFILSIGWLYLADDGGASAMGASLGYGFNRAGIQ